MDKWTLSENVSIQSNSTGKATQECEMIQSVTQVKNTKNAQWQYF